MADSIPKKRKTRRDEQSKSQKNNRECSIEDHECFNSIYGRFVDIVDRYQRKEKVSLYEQEEVLSDAERFWPRLCKIGHAVFGLFNFDVSGGYEASLTMFKQIIVNEPLCQPKHR